jgi:hypothetical protein
MTTNKHIGSSFDDFLKEEVFDCESWIKWVNEYKEVKEREQMLIHEAIEMGWITDAKD